MLRKNPSGDMPVIAESAFIDPTAIICGKVEIHDNVFIGPYAVIRADEVDENGSMCPIIIKQDSNIQDGVVIHSKSGAAVTIGERSSIAHRSIVHGPCEVGDGRDLPEKFHVPPMTNIGPEFDLDTISTVSPEYSSFSESVVSANHYLVKGYKKLANEL